MFVAKQLQAIKLDVQEIKKHLLDTDNFDFNFPIKTLEDLNVLEEKINSTSSFAMEVVRIIFDLFYSV